MAFYESNHDARARFLCTSREDPDDLVTRLPRGTGLGSGPALRSEWEADSARDFADQFEERHRERYDHEHVCVGCGKKPKCYAPGCMMPIKFRCGACGG